MCQIVLKSKFQVFGGYDFFVGVRRYTVCCKIEWKQHYRQSSKGGPVVEQTGLTTNNDLPKQKFRESLG